MGRRHKTWRPSGRGLILARLVGQARKNRQLLHAARAEARRFADEHPSPDADPGEALQWLVNRIFDQLKFAAQKADGLSEDEMEVMTAFGPMPAHWIRLENDLRKELATLCVNVERVGLADRMVRLQEAKTALLVQAVLAAAQDAGIPRAKIKALGPALRNRLELVQGGKAA